MSTISNRKKRFTVKLSSVVWDRGLWLTELSVMVNMPNQHHFQRLILERLMRCWMICLLGRGIGSQIGYWKHQCLGRNLWACWGVKGDLYTPFIDKAEETVAELTYKKAFEIYGNPLPDIVDLRIEKELTSIWGMDLLWFIWHRRCWYNVLMNGATWLVLVGLSDLVSLRPWLGLQRSILSLLTMSVVSVSTVSLSQMVLMVQVLICPIRTVLNVVINSVKWAGYSIRDLPWFWWGQGSRYWLELLGRRSASAHLDDVIFLVRNMHSVQEQLVQ